MGSTPEITGESFIERQVRDELMAALERAIARPNEVQRPPLVVPAQPEAARPRSRPITFNAAMVRALLAGNKSQTRRPIQPQPTELLDHRGQPWPASAEGRPLECRLAHAGELLWVREPFSRGRSGRGRFEYEADFGPAVAAQRAWQPGRFLPRTGSRIFLRVLGVLPQRLNDLTPHDAAAEGLPAGLIDGPEAAIEWFRRLWDSFYGGTDLTWASDPWVWVVRFKVIGEEELKDLRR